MTRVPHAVPSIPVVRMIANDLPQPSSVRELTMKQFCLFGALLSVLGACTSGMNASNTTTSPAVAAIDLQGVPPDSVNVASSYVFTPTLASGPTAGLRFAIEGLPAWAHFDASTGTISGTPTIGAVGVSAEIVIFARDGVDTGSIGPFTIRVIPPNADGLGTPPQVVTSPSTTGGSSPGAAALPSIAGNPAQEVLANQGYKFIPTATDPADDALTFSIQNAPSWATFNSVTGELSGTPTLADVGTFSKIEVSVSDGTHSAALAQFSIVVTETAGGTASLTWIPPTYNTDGTALTNLAGYRIYYGNHAGELTHIIAINNAGTTDYVVGNLTPGTWYFTITALADTHAESAESSVRTTAVL